MLKLKQYKYCILGNRSWLFSLWSISNESFVKDKKIWTNIFSILENNQTQNNSPSSCMHHKAIFAPEDIRNEIPTVLWLKNGPASTTIQKTLNKFDTFRQWNKFKTYCTINLTHLISGINLELIVRLLLCVHHSSMHHNSFHLLS